MISPLDRVGHRALDNHIVKVGLEGQGTIGNISTLAFDLGKSEKDMLFKNGQLAAQLFIPNFEKKTDME